MNWLPVTWLSHMLDVQMYGLDARGHHLTSVFLHALNAGLLLILLRRMTGSVWRSAVAAALFAVHPLRVESVSWIAERKDVLCATFFLLTLLAYVHYARKPSLGRYLSMLALYALGLMSKTMLVTVPFLLLLLDGWPLKRVPPGRLSALDDLPPAGPSRRWRWLILEKLPLLLLAAIASAWTAVLQKQGGAADLSAAMNLGRRSANAAIGVWRYLGKSLLPTELSALYPYPPSWPVPAVALAVAGLVAVTAAALYQGRRRPYLPVGWFWFLGMLVPVSGLVVQVGTQSIADRYTYLPGIGLLLLGVWGAADLLRRWPAALRFAPHAVAVIVSVLAVMTYFRQEDWRTDLDLWANAVAVEPRNWLAQHNLAHALYAAGQPEEAIAAGRVSLSIKSDNYLMRTALATWLLEQGRPGESAEQMRALVQQLPTSPEAHVGLATALSRLGDAHGADAAFARAAALAPGSAAVQASWAAALANQGRTAEAASHAREALQLDPGNELARSVLGK